MTGKRPAASGIQTVRLRRKLVSGPSPQAPAGSAPPRPVAVVDCGTSSVRAFIAEICGGEIRLLDDLVHPVDLTGGLTGGKLDRVEMDHIAEAVGGILQTAREYGISEVRAVGTSALREAANSDVLVERLRAEFGLQLEIIDAAEAARLYFEALRQLQARSGFELPGNALLIDIGAGSTCVSLIRGGRLAHSVDEHFGTIRLWEDFKGLKDSTDFSLTIDRYALGAARMMLGRLPERAGAHLVVTGGEVRRLLQILHPEADSMIDELDPSRLEGWLERMHPLTPQQRAEACGCDEVSTARLLPAASLLRHLCRESGAGRVLVPQITLRDGLLADQLPGAQGPHHLDAVHLMEEARQLVSRYGGNLGYAENTASLAVQLFDQTRILHRLGERERALLQFSAMVHDIGSYINVRNRHKHTMYLIQSVDLAGLTRLEKAMVANIARYHRKSPPEPHHQEYVSLPRRERVVVGHLAAILRLAYALDVERTQRIRTLQATVDGNRLLIRVDRRQIALEAWSVAGKGGLFSEVFGLQPVVIPRLET